MTTSCMVIEPTCTVGATTREKAKVPATVIAEEP